MPDLGYIICTTPRSGSTMLCQLLAATGATGNPHSYFREEDLEDWAEDWGVPFEGLPTSNAPSRDFLDAAITEARGNTSVFGLRLMHESLSGLLNYLRALSLDDTGDRDCLEAAFGPLVFIHLQRDDTVDQAISLLRAEQTGLWHSAEDGTDIERLEPVQNPGYDFGRLHAYAKQLEAQKAAWPSWFQSQGITPLAVSYDALSDDPAGAVITICTALGVPPPTSDDIKVPTARLRDATNVEWKARYAKGLLGLSD